MNTISRDVSKAFFGFVIAAISVIGMQQIATSHYIVIYENQSANEAQYKDVVAPEHFRDNDNEYYYY